MDRVRKTLRGAARAAAAGRRGSIGLGLRETPVRIAAATAVCAALVLASTRPTPAPEASPAASPQVRAGYEKAAGEVLCYCGCARQTVLDCTCGVAFGLREQFEARLAKGETADSLIASYIAEHGEQSRNVPPRKGLNLLAWFGPGIAIILAAGGVIVTLLLWTRRGRSAAPQADLAAEPGVEDELRRRMEKELKEFDA
jgi:cytochrome c-type biogenesis protein CcmH/NrfF